MTIEKRYDVLVVGELNVDLIFNTMDSLPEIGKEILAKNLTLTLGSSSAIFANNLTTLGSSVTLVGRLGYDYFGDYIFTCLSGKGVDVSHILRSREHDTGATVVLNFQEDRAMATYPGAMAFLTLKDITEDVLQQSNHLHLSSVFLQEGLRNDIGTLFKRAKAVGLTTSLDPQWDPSEVWDLNLQTLLPYVDIFMPNENELKALTRTSDRDRALEEIKPLVNTLVIKNGREGAYLWDGRELTHQPAFINPAVVDSVGAGDSFNAGFIHRFLQQKPLRECLEFGAITGAISTTHAGGIGAFENLELAKKIAKSFFSYSIP